MILQNQLRGEPISESERSIHQDNSTQSSIADPETINKLIADLAKKDGLVRVNARHSLVAIGGQAVDPLVKALANKKGPVRWEAAKTPIQTLL